MTDRLERKLTAEDEARIHRAGSAWTDLGTHQLAAVGPRAWAASVDCHRRAVELLSELPATENFDYMADLGAAWVNLGCALQAGPSRDSQEEALAAFDRAVDLLGMLPYRDRPRFRHNLAAAWRNRADAHSQIDAPASRENGRKAYRRAIEIAGELPFDEKPSFRILLASCCINLGNLEQRVGDFRSAIRAYEAAVAAIGNLSRSGHRLACHHAATAWINLGEAVLSFSESGNAVRAVAAGRIGLAQVEGRDLGGPVDAKLSLRGLRVVARGLESAIRGGVEPDAARIAEITDIAERGLDLAFGGHERDPGFFDPFIVWFFSFGGRIYGRHQPQFLAEYLGEGLGRLDPRGDPALAAEIRSIAAQVSSSALGALGHGRLFVAGTRQTDLVMSTVRELRTVAAQFNS